MSNDTEVADPLGAGSAQPGRSLSSSQRKRTLEITFVVLGALAVTLIHAQRLDGASLWYDEAATYSGASRPLSRLWEMVGSVDAVHGFFYLLMHPIVAMIGPHAGGMRLVSTVAVGVTCIAIYGLARLFGTPASATAAAIVFAALGRTSWMATEARSFALATFLSVVLTVNYLLVLRSKHPRRWAILYAFVALVGVQLFLYTALVVAAHAVSLALVRPARERVVSLAIAMVCAAAGSLPLAGVVVAQRNQLGGTFPIDLDVVRHVLVGEAFHRSAIQAVLVWVALGAATGWLLARRVRAPQRTRNTAWRTLGPWLVLPTLFVLLVSAVSPTIYQPRAMVICAPALCILLTEEVRRASGGVLAIAVAGATAFAGVGAYAANRELTAKNADWPIVASVLEDRALPGDGILYSTPIDYRTWPSLIGLMHPNAVAGLEDVAFVTSGSERGALFDMRVPSSETVAALRELDRVWYVRSRALDDADLAEDFAALRAAGLACRTVVEGPLSAVEEWDRSFVTQTSLVAWAP